MKLELCTLIKCLRKYFWGILKIRKMAELQLFKNGRKRKMQVANFNMGRYTQVAPNDLKLFIWSPEGIGMFPRVGHVDLRGILRGVMTPRSHIWPRTEIFWEQKMIVLTSIVNLPSFKKFGKCLLFWYLAGLRTISLNSKKIKIFQIFWLDLTWQI